MEDFYDVKLTEIDGQAVSLFGVFDGMDPNVALFNLQYFVYHVFLSISGALGHGGSRAAEYLKEHLFENLLKHPEFLTDTKLAISIIFSHKASLQTLPVAILVAATNDWKFMSKNRRNISENRYRFLGIRIKCLQG